MTNEDIWRQTDIWLSGATDRKVVFGRIGGEHFARFQEPERPAVVRKSALSSTSAMGECLVALKSA